MMTRSRSRTCHARSFIPLTRLAHEGKFCVGAPEQMNPEISFRPIQERLQPANAESIISGHQVVVDCTDNLDARLLINETCVKASIPFVYGAVLNMKDRFPSLMQNEGPCLRCMLPEQAFCGHHTKPGKSWIALYGPRSDWTVTGGGSD